MTVEAIEAAEAAPVRSREDQAWARWLARGLDALFLLPFSLLFFTGVGVAAELGLLPAEIVDWAQDPLFSNIAGIVATFVLFLLWEPLFLSNAGTTPGKWVMGVRVRDEAGAKLGVFKAALRFVWVFFAGTAAGIPLLSAITALHARGKLTTSGATGWDLGLKCKVTHTPRPTMVWVLVIMLVIGINVMVLVFDRMA